MFQYFATACEPHAEHSPSVTSYITSLTAFAHVTLHITSLTAFAHIT